MKKAVTKIIPSRRRRLYNAILHHNPVAYYPLGEMSGAVAQNHATQNRYNLDGTVSGCTVGQPGKIGKAYSFDGTDDEVNRTLITNATTSVSTIILMKSDDYTRNRQGVFSHGSSTQGYALVLSGNATTDGSLFVLHHGIAWHDTNYNLQDNNWHILVLTFSSATTGRLYVDGTQVWTATAPPLSIGTPQTITRIGSDGTSTFKGKAQHFAIVGKELSPGEVMQLAHIAGFA